MFPTSSSVKSPVNPTVSAGMGINSDRILSSDRLEELDDLAAAAAAETKVFPTVIVCPDHDPISEDCYGGETLVYEIYTTKPAGA